MCKEHIRKSIEFWLGGNRKILMLCCRANHRVRHAPWSGSYGVFPGTSLHEFRQYGVLRSSRDPEPYRGGPTNSESYFSFSSANILFCSALLRFTPSPSVDNLTNSSASRSGPPGMKAISNLPRSVPSAL